MTNIYDVGKVCLRYLVPFQFNESFDKAVETLEGQTDRIKATKDESEEMNKENPENSKNSESKLYVKIEDKWFKKQKFWIRNKENSENSKNSESDLYEYVKNEFRFNSDDKLSAEKNGCSWLLWRSAESPVKGNQPIKTLHYYSEGIKKPTANSESEGRISKV